MVVNSVIELIGNTPILKLNKYTDKNIYAKLEYLNPAGSAKDRVALSMIEDAEAKGILKPGAIIIEPTSGNTGIGLALVAVAKGYDAILTLPDTMSVERRKLLAAYGAKLVLTEGAKGMAGAIEKANELSKELPNSFVAGQFENMANPDAHYLTTGPEIYEDMDGDIDYFVCAVGTGGTISGVGRYLKERNPSVRVVAVEPKSSPLLSQGVSGAHKIQGIGANFVPTTLDTQIYDEIITVSDEEAYEYTALLSKKQGVLGGISSGCALYAAVQSAKREKGKKIVVLLPDTGMRYLSSGVWDK